MALEVSVVCADVTAVDADVLLLKHARAFYGADETVAVRLLGQAACREQDITPAYGDYALVDSRGAIAARQALFLGTPSLGGFRYREMRHFARQAIEVIATRCTQAESLACTVHGAGYGLDIEESFRSLVMGFQQGLAMHPLPKLARVVFVERSKRRFDFLSQLVADVDLVQGTHAQAASATHEAAATPTAPLVAFKPEPKKKCVFVAMPFSEEFDDVYQFGIYSTVRRCGYVCEKVDESAFAGNIVDRITEGIRNADFVIADLSLERPNVYLEVGFAWGLQRPVILVAREGQKLHFDLSHHKCLFYKTIGKLADALEKSILDMFGRGSDGSDGR